MQITELYQFCAVGQIPGGFSARMRYGAERNSTRKNVPNERRGQELGRTITGKARCRAVAVRDATARANRMAARKYSDTK